jgi:hypothetical protein
MHSYIKDEALEKLLRYADYHFHTAYSDNRDRATIRQMVDAGLACGITAFGTGDHNHNLSLESWTRQRAETEKLGSLIPDVSIVNNCEITFRIGHALVIEPSRIEGSAREGFFYLLSGQKQNLVIVNHPYLPSDRFRGTFLPHAAGIEAINGSTLRSLLRDGFLDAWIEDESQDSLISYPHIACYAAYLDRGFPVSVLGNSDAHTLDEIGLGVTGFIDESCSTSIRNWNTFAATDTGIALHWRFDKEGGRVDYKALCDGGPVPVQWYRGSQPLGLFPASGSLDLTTPGLYWFGFHRHTRFALSSPIAVGQPPSLSGDGSYNHLWALYYNCVNEEKVSHPTWFYGSEKTRFTNREGAEVSVTFAFVEHDVVIDKSGPLSILDELYLWLDRNEIHEYRFFDLQYLLDRGTLSVKAHLIPSLLIEDKQVANRYREASDAIRTMREQARGAEIYIDVLPLFRLETEASDLVAEDPVYHVTSHIVSDVGTGNLTQKFFDDIQE